MKFINPPEHTSDHEGVLTMNHRKIRTGLLAAALAGGTLLGATQIGGVVNAQADDAPVEERERPIFDDLTEEEREQLREERRERREARREVRQANGQEVADLLGVETDVLRDWIHGGGTLAEIAEQNGVDVDAVVDLIVEQKNERIDTALENGRIDADDADEIRAELEERVTTRVNEGRPERGEGEGFGPRGDRGPRGGHGGPADAPAVDDGER